MQPKKIIISLLVVMLLAFCTLSAFATTEVAALDVAVTVETATATVEAGDVVEISVTAGEWSGASISVMTLKLEFDADALEIAQSDIVAGTAYQNSVGTPQIMIDSFQSAGKYADLVVINFNSYEGAGDMVKLSFHVKDVHGDTVVKISSFSAVEEGTYDNVAKVVDDGAVTLSVHAYGDPDVTLPTCTTPGYTTYTCELDGCGKQLVTDHKDPLDHDRTGPAATCTDPQVCAREDCNEVLVPALDHKPGPAATCKAPQVCTREGCGIELVPAGTHVPVAPATCTEDSVCQDCGTKIEDKLGHAPGAAATCTTAQICTREGCGVELNPALDHIPGAAPTCTTNQVCTREGCGVELAPALGHAPGAAATCTTNQVCTREDCGVELVAALGHQPGAAATCTAAQVCTREGCGVQLAAKLAHTYGDWAVEKEATRKEEGVKAKTCSACSDKITEAIPMVEGGFPWWIVIVLGSIAVLGGGGFLVYRFLLRDDIQACGGFGPYFKSKFGKKNS